MRRRFLILLPVLLTAAILQTGLASQEPRPTYDSATGPVIAVDGGHKNTTTYDRYPSWIELLKGDGYRPRPLTQSISAASLADVRILVMNDPQTSLSDDEVSVVVAWLKGGGSLLLVLDHYASIQSKLTASLGVKNWPGNSAGVPDVINILFWRSEFFPVGAPKLGVTGSGGGQGYQGPDAVLAKHAITEGRGPGERIRRVVTFSGSAFEALPGGVPLLTLPRSAGLGAATETPLLPNVVLGVDKLRGTSAAGWLQGAVIEVGKGRLAIFADSAVVSGGRSADKDQFNDNGQFALNLMRWLSRVL
jgi:hypothetical protein